MCSYLLSVVREQLVAGSVVVEVVDSEITIGVTGPVGAALNMSCMVENML